MLPLYGRVTLEERMVDAVEHTDIDSLRNLMKKFNRDRLAHDEKKKALQHVLATCGDVLQATENPSMLSSGWRDTTAFLGGALIAVYGLSYVAYYGKTLQNPPAHDDRSWLLAKFLGSAGLTCFGLYHLMNGVRKQSQRSMHETARRIEDYLESSLRELDLPSKGAIS